jgi:hypothetical protein
MIADRFEQDELRGMFCYLDDVRECGLVNMFGAAYLLVDDEHLVLPGPFRRQVSIIAISVDRLWK